MISPFIMIGADAAPRDPRAPAPHRAPAAADPPGQALGDEHGHARTPRRADPRGMTRSPGPSATSWALTPGTSSGLAVVVALCPPSASSAISTCFLPGPSAEPGMLSSSGRGGSMAWMRPSRPCPLVGAERPEGLEAAVEGGDLLPAERRRPRGEREVAPRCDQEIDRARGRARRRVTSEVVQATPAARRIRPKASVWVMRSAP